MSLYFLLWNSLFIYRSKKINPILPLGAPTNEEREKTLNLISEHKRGKFLFDNGDIYDGEWSDNDIYGCGNMKYKNGDIYDGEWDLCGKHGQGKMVYKNGDVYEGTWFRNNRYGNGKITYKNGDIYEGMVY
jgi:hypothetical protein